MTSYIRRIDLRVCVYVYITSRCVCIRVCIYTHIYTYTCKYVYVLYRGRECNIHFAINRTYVCCLSIEAASIWESDVPGCACGVSSASGGDEARLS